MTLLMEISNICLGLQKTLDACQGRGCITNPFRIVSNARARIDARLFVRLFTIAHIIFFHLTQC